MTRPSVAQDEIELMVSEIDADGNDEIDFEGTVGEGRGKGAGSVVGQGGAGGVRAPAPAGGAS